MDKTVVRDYLVGGAGGQGRGMKVGTKQCQWQKRKTTGMTKFKDTLFLQHLETNVNGEASGSVWEIGKECCREEVGGQRKRNGRAGGTGGGRRGYLYSEVTVSATGK